MRLFSKNYNFHEPQQQVASSQARFITAVTGRRFGKTLMSVKLLVRTAWNDVGDYAWIAPTYPITERGIDALKTTVNPQAFRVSGRPQVCHLASGSRIYFASADSPDPRSILGHGFKGVVVDEAARIHTDAWHYVIRPTLSDHMGWALFTTTPKGRNWVYDMFTRGNEGDPDYDSFSFPSKANPHFPPEEWEQAQATMPSDVFRQEYMAEFLDDSAGVFRGVDDCLRSSTCNHGQFVVGVDLAKHQDYTVSIALCSQCGMVHAVDRYNHIDWPLQKGRIIAFAKRFRAPVYLDSTGVGDGIYDDLKSTGMTIRGVKLTSQTKTELIQSLMVGIEQQQVGFLAEHETLRSELKRYEYIYTPNGTLTYNAPSGYHDDCVIALALAWKGYSKSTPAMVMV